MLLLEMARTGYDNDMFPEMTTTGYENGPELVKIMICAQ